MSFRQRMYAGSAFCFVAAAAFFASRGSAVALVWWIVGIAASVLALTFFLVATAMRCGRG